MRKGAQNLAVLQVVVATCILHTTCPPYQYIKDILFRLQTHKPSKIDELLLWHWPEFEKTA